MPNKYITLNDLKAVIVATTPAQDKLLQDALDWAEGILEEQAMSQFDQQTETLVQPFRVTVDRYGWLTLVARERGPVTVVSAIQVRNPANRTWFPLTWVADDIILPPVDTIGPASAGSWTVKVIPSSPLLQVAEGGLLARWTYTGGYAEAPARLRMVVERLALWKYKLKDAPLGRVSMPAMGVTEMIPALPDDALADVRLWANTDKL